MTTFAQRWLLGLAYLLFLIAPASADTVNLTLVSAGSDARFGVYISPYTGVVTNTAAQFFIICDDFVDESFIGQHWAATVHTLNDLTGTKWGPSNSTQYSEAAWLAYQILSTPNPDTRGKQSFALWALFAPAQVQSYLGGQYANETGYWLGQAQSSTLTASQRSRVLIYTPTTTTQEFLRIIPAPEPSELAMLAVNLLSVLALCLVFRKRRTGFGRS